MDRKIDKKRWTLKRIVWLSVSLIFIAAILYGIIFGDHRAKLNVDLERITISTVTQEPFQEFIPIRGNVVPILTVYLDAVEGGRVEKIFVEEGGMVQEGDSILQLSNPTLELSVMNQEALIFEQMNNFQNIRISLDQQEITRQDQMIEIEHRLAEAGRTFFADEKLHARGLVTQQAYETSRENCEYWKKKREFMTETLRQDSLYRQGQVANLESAVRRLEMNLAAVKRNLENLFVKAPVSGQLSFLDAEIGESKSQGQRLGQVDVLDGFRVRAKIDEYYISRIQRGQSATCSLGGRTCRLLLTKVYPEVRDGEFEVDLEFVEETPEDIRRGQTLQIRLALGDLTEALLVDRGGFYQSTGGNWAFVVDPTSSFAVRRTIKVGRQNTEYFEVLEGLEPGERVITSSYENYLDVEKLVLKE
jgi:HlyD family secretion protein